MADKHGRDLAKRFYKLIVDFLKGSPYYELSAPLDAVQRLRGKTRTTLERWVN
jgi:hypothetical protein